MNDDIARFVRVEVVMANTSRRHYDDNSTRAEAETLTVEGKVTLSRIGGGEASSRS